MLEGTVKEPLTKRQKTVLQFVANFFQKNGFAPSLREIGKALKMASPRGVQKHLESLEAKGYLYRTRNARSIHLFPTLFSTLSHHIINLPLIGSIAAGKPMLAEENVEEIIPIAQSIFGSIHEGFLLKVKGDSMIEANIAPGDFVVIKPQATAENGEIVAAVIEGEVTLKRFYKDKNVVRLKPANPHYEEIRVQGNFKIAGKVIGLIRNYQR